MHIKSILLVIGKKFIHDYFLCTQLFYLHVCMCMNFIGDHGGQKITLDTLVLELQMVVKHHVDAGN